MTANAHIICRAHTLECAQKNQHHAITGVRWIKHHSTRYHTYRRYRVTLNAHISLLLWSTREVNALTPRAPPAPMYSALASWYGPGFYGHTMACGGTLTEGTNGVANKTMACGTQLRVCYNGRCAETSVVDRGPYVAGREFDLTGWLASTLGFGGVGTVSYSFTSGDG